MHMKIRGKTYSGASFAEMSKTYCDIRDRLGFGASRFNEVFITEDGKRIARISYNGRVWSPEPWVSGMAPLYDNRSM